MAGVATDESGAGWSFEGVTSGELQSQNGEITEWRSSEQVENGSPSTSPPYWDSDDEDDVGGLKPSDLYGKYTWKIDKFSQINKRELRSNAFEVGGYKWYILIYPQGCDVCNHLSLFLCVANHDKLLPGWSHFAQFTIAVVNKDPKKSKYSDTLHRFWKKEHDWGWKKFMELSKVLDGFIDADTLIIKAQVQVIRERVDRPFRCLDCQYRRELVRVYLTNVEQICRRFVEERRGKLLKLIEDTVRWDSFCAFWEGMDQNIRRRMSQEKTESVLKVVVKHFFIEKEVTSTLVMDSLYSGLKALEGKNKGKKSKDKYSDYEELLVPLVCIEKDTFALVDDLLLLLQRAAIAPLPPKDEKGPQNRTKDGTVGEEFNKDCIERDERRLTELGRRTIEIFVLAQIFSKIEVAYQEAVALMKQEELIREEEAAWMAEIEQKARRGAVDKEKKSKKKQAKQKRNNRKGKDKGRDDKTSITVHDKMEEEYPEKHLSVEAEFVLKKSEAVEDVSDVSDSVPQMRQPDSEDRDTSQNGMNRRNPSLVDDSSSTCSSDSVPSIAMSVLHKGNSQHEKNQKSSSRGRNYRSKLTSETDDWANEGPSQLQEAVPNAKQQNNAFQSFKRSPSKATAKSVQDRVNGAERHVGKKEEETGPLHRSSGTKDADAVKLSVDKPISGTSKPKSPSKLPTLFAEIKLESKINPASEPVMVKKPSPYRAKQADRAVLLSNPTESAPTLKPDAQKSLPSKPTERPSVRPVHVSEKRPSQEAPVKTDNKPSIPPTPVVMSRPLSAPLVPAGPRPAVSMVSVAQTAPVLARSVSAAGRLGPETSTAYPETSTAYPSSSAHNYIPPQSYRNAIIGQGSVNYSQNHSASSSASLSYSYSQSQAPPALLSTPLYSPRDRMDPAQSNTSFSFGMVNHHHHHDNILQNTPLWIDPHQRNNNNDYGTPVATTMQGGFDLYNHNAQSSRLQDHLHQPHANTSGLRQSHISPEDFPHLDIINDLLDDETGIGMAAADVVNSGYRSFGNGPHNMGRQHSFPGELVPSSGPGPSLSDRARNYHDNGFQSGYGVPQRASQRPYVNGQMEGFMASQWQVGGQDLSYLGVRSNVENDGYQYHVPEYPDMSVGMNGYTVFRPSNGL